MSLGSQHHGGYVFWIGCLAILSLIWGGRVGGHPVEFLPTEVAMGAHTVNANSMTDEEELFLASLAAYRTRYAEDAQLRMEMFKEGIEPELKQNSTSIHVDQSRGRNLSSVTGTDQDPFKSITYAMLTMASRNTLDPWAVVVRSAMRHRNPSIPVAHPSGHCDIFSYIGIYGIELWRTEKSQVQQKLLATTGGHRRPPSGSRN